MHPAFLYWWKYGRRYADCGTWAGYGPDVSFRRREEQHASGPHRHEDSLGASLGVRRPLRFMAYKLDLNETQVGQLARILNDLKTERAQAEVDGRRTVSAFAAAVEADAFGDAKAAEGADQRVESARRLRDAVLKALRDIHGMLTPEQRTRLAYLIRTGALTL